MTTITQTPRLTDTDPVTGDLVAQRIMAQREYGRAIRSHDHVCKCGAPATRNDRSAHSDGHPTCDPCGTVLAMLRSLSAAAFRAEVSL